MIVRIVKMSFVPGKENDFLEVFAASHHLIRGFEGCTHLELLRDKKDPCVFFTYSHWDSEQHLEAYRNSELFKNVWARTSALFREKAAAWTLEKTVP